MTKRRSSSSSPNAAKNVRVLRATFCQNCKCQREATSLWRTNPEPQEHEALDNVLCNACGLYRNEHGIQRPAKYWASGGRRSSFASAGKASSATSDDEEPRTPVPKRRQRRASTFRKDSKSPQEPKNIEDGEVRTAEQEVEDAARALLSIKSCGRMSSEDGVATSDPDDFEPASPSSDFALPDYRPAWVFNRPGIVQIIPPPFGFHPTTPRRASIYSCCPSVPLIPGLPPTPTRMTNGFSLEKYQLQPSGHR